MSAMRRFGLLAAVIAALALASLLVSGGEDEGGEQRPTSRAAKARQGAAKAGDRKAEPHGRRAESEREPDLTRRIRLALQESEEIPEDPHHEELDAQQRQRVKDQAAAHEGAAEVGREFVSAFVYYEVGRATNVDWRVLRRTAAPELFAELEAQPPRLPPGARLRPARLLGWEETETLGEGTAQIPVVVGLVASGRRRAITVEVSAQGVGPPVVSLVRG